MSGLKLLTEIQENVNVSNNEEKDFFIEGVFMEADNRNRNGRIYPKPILEREVNRYVKECIGKNSPLSLGELNHPNHPQVNTERASHKIQELKFDGNLVYGKAKIVDTPVGSIVKSLLKEGIVFGVSSRGLGSVEEQNGSKIVQSDFVLTTVDIVSDPSVAKAMVHGIMEEKEWIVENGIYKEVKSENPDIYLQNTKDNINKIVREIKDKKEREQKFLEMFHNYIAEIKK